MKVKNNIFYIGAIVLYALIVSCSANQAYKQSRGFDEALEEAPDMVINPTESVGYEFEDEQLSDIALKAFEERAGQKLRDCMEYMALLSDKSLDTVFIDQARVMLQRLFFDNKAVIKIKSNNQLNSVPIQLKEFTQYLIDGEKGKLNFKVNDVEVLDSLQLTDIRSYSGKIDCLIEVKNTGTFSLLHEGKYRATINIHAKKTNKSFGTVDKQLWEVFLGNIVLTQLP
jgi:hypothetical protein